MSPMPCFPANSPILKVSNMAQVSSSCCLSWGLMSLGFYIGLDMVWLADALGESLRFVRNACMGNCLWRGCVCERVQKLNFFLYHWFAWGLVFWTTQLYSWCGFAPSLECWWESSSLGPLSMLPYRGCYVKYWDASTGILQCGHSSTINLELIFHEVAFNVLLT